MACFVLETRNLVRDARLNMRIRPLSVKPILAQVKGLLFVASLFLAASHTAVALDAVSMQLKWKHQFQFAG